MSGMLGDLAFRVWFTNLFTVTCKRQVVCVDKVSCLSSSKKSDSGGEKLYKVSEILCFQKKKGWKQARAFFKVCYGSRLC